MQICVDWEIKLLYNYIMNSETSIKQQIYSVLRDHGIVQEIEIEPEAEGMILLNLQDPKLHRVWLDSDGTLMMDFDDWFL